ncbi:MAG: hypothetical protein K8I82_03590, partial [Anaerolineae bacterium]|nr:hypothetical protein [Anaerolineae bacterium]
TARGLGSVTSTRNLASLAPRDCFQLVTSLAAANEEIPREVCANILNWVAPSRASIFWTTQDDGAEEFTIYDNRRQVATCSLDEIFCEFSLPRLPLFPTTTSTPTASPSITASPAPATREEEIQLVYDQTSIYLLNTGTQFEDISELQFTQMLSNGSSRTFSAREWMNDRFPSGQGSIFALSPGGCYQLFSDTASTTIKPAECQTRFGWTWRSDSYHFWLAADNDSEAFTVYLEDEVIVQCQIDAGNCEFSLP